MLVVPFGGPCRHVPRAALLQCRRGWRCAGVAPVAALDHVATAALRHREPSRSMHAAPADAEGHRGVRCVEDDVWINGVQDGTIILMPAVSRAPTLRSRPTRSTSCSSWKRIAECSEHELKTRQRGSELRSSSGLESCANGRRAGEVEHEARGLGDVLLRSASHQCLQRAPLTTVRRA